MYDFLQIVPKFPASLDIAKFKKIHAFQVNKCSIILLCTYILFELWFLWVSSRTELSISYHISSRTELSISHHNWKTTSWRPLIKRLVTCFIYWNFPEGLICSNYIEQQPYPHLIQLKSHHLELINEERNDQYFICLFQCLNNCLAFMSHM